MTVAAVKDLGKKIPILGVCLGHQAICAAFGAEVTYAKRLMHGKQSLVKLDTGCPLFYGCPESILTTNGKQMLKNFIRGGQNRD